MSWRTKALNAMGVFLAHSTASSAIFVSTLVVDIDNLLRTFNPETGDEILYTQNDLLLPDTITLTEGDTLHLTLNFANGRRIQISDNVSDKKEFFQMSVRTPLGQESAESTSDMDISLLDPVGEATASNFAGGSQSFANGNAIIGNFTPINFTDTSLSFNGILLSTLIEKLENSETNEVVPRTFTQVRLNLRATEISVIPEPNQYSVMLAGACLAIAVWARRRIQSLIG